MGRTDGARFRLRRVAEYGQASLCRTSFVLKATSTLEDHPGTDHINGVRLLPAAFANHNSHTPRCTDGASVRVRTQHQESTIRTPGIFPVLHSRAALQRCRMCRSRFAQHPARSPHPVVSHRLDGSASSPNPTQTWKSLSDAHRRRNCDHRVRCCWR